MIKFLKNLNLKVFTLIIDFIFNLCMNNTLIYLFNCFYLKYFYQFFQMISSLFLHQFL